MTYKLGWKIYLKSRWNFVLDTYNSRQDLTEEGILNHLACSKLEEGISQ